MGEQELKKMIRFGTQEGFTEGRRSGRKSRILKPTLHRFYF